MEYINSIVANAKNITNLCTTSGNKISPWTLTSTDQLPLIKIDEIQKRTIKWECFHCESRWMLTDYPWNTPRLLWPDRKHSYWCTLREYFYFIRSFRFKRTLGFRRRFPNWYLSDSSLLLVLRQFTFSFFSLTIATLMIKVKNSPGSSVLKVAPYRPATFATRDIPKLR